MGEGRRTDDPAAAAPQRRPSSATCPALTTLGADGHDHLGGAARPGRRRRPGPRRARPRAGRPHADHDARAGRSTGWSTSPPSHLGAVPCTVYATLSTDQLRYLAPAQRRAGDRGRGRGAARTAGARSSTSCPSCATSCVVDDAARAGGDRGSSRCATSRPAARRAHAGRPGARSSGRGARCGPEQPVTLLYTSGTTGDPKGVRAQPPQRASTSRWRWRRRSTCPTTPRSLAYLPLAHIAERMLGIYNPIYRAGHVTICADPTQLLAGAAAGAAGGVLRRPAGLGEDGRRHPGPLAARPTPQREAAFEAASARRARGVPAARGRAGRCPTTSPRSVAATGRRGAAAGPGDARPGQRAVGRQRRGADPGGGAALPRRPRARRPRGLGHDRDHRHRDDQHARRLPHRHGRPAQRRHGDPARRRRRDPGPRARWSAWDTCAPTAASSRSPTPTAGSPPATSARSTRTGTSRSPTARRNSSSPPAGRTSRRRRSRTCCGRTR